MRFLAATDGREATTVLLREYLQDRLAADDTVHLIHSLEGDDGDAGFGDDQSDLVLRGRESLESLEEWLGERVDVETHQLIRGNEPPEDVLQLAHEEGVDEIVVGIRQRSAGERALFGSTAQSILQRADRPVVALPLPEDG